PASRATRAAINGPRQPAMNRSRSGRVMFIYLTRRLAARQPSLPPFAATGSTALMSEPTPDISVAVPVPDEEGAAGPLAREIAAAFAGRSYEMIFVDDASRDGTLAELRALMTELPALRVLAHASNAGQSRAVRTGVLAARAPIVVTL